MSLMLFLGCYCLWANINVYVLSYFYQFNPNLSLGFIFVVDTLLCLCNVIGYNVGLYLLNAKRFHPKLIIGFAGGCALLGNYLSSYTRSLGPYLALYTGLNGFGSGICYMVPLTCAWEYFPEKKGMITGIIIATFGLSALIFSPLSTHLVNPEGKNPTI